MSSRGDSKILASKMVERRRDERFVVVTQDTAPTLVIYCLLLQSFPTLVNVVLVLAFLTAEDSAATCDLDVAEMPLAFHRNTAARSAN